MDRLLQLEVFAKTAELNSLSKAAETLGMSNAAASRHLSALEERLATRLIERNTRRLWLTEVGQEFLQRCGVLLNEVAEAEDAVSERALSPKGLLRVTSSLSFATIYLAPMLPEFRMLYPKLNVQIIAANRYPDFIEAGIDVAIRTREQEPDSNIIVRRIGPDAARAGRGAILSCALRISRNPRRSRPPRHAGLQSRQRSLFVAAAARRRLEA
jgi:DNA-binding transcriptional LysR family regulator